MDHDYASRTAAKDYHGSDGGTRGRSNDDLVAVTVRPIRHLAQLPFRAVPVPFWIALWLSLLLPLSLRLVEFFFTPVLPSTLFPILRWYQSWKSRSS
jgi:hypothetical protein